MDYFRPRCCCCDGAPARVGEQVEDLWACGSGGKSRAGRVESGQANRPRLSTLHSPLSTADPHPIRRLLGKQPEVAEIGPLELESQPAESDGPSGGQFSPQGPLALLRLAGLILRPTPCAAYIASLEPRVGRRPSTPGPPVPCLPLAGHGRSSTICAEPFQPPAIAKVEESIVVAERRRRFSHRQSRRVASIRTTGQVLPTCLPPPSAFS